MELKDLHELINHKGIARAGTGLTLARNGDASSPEYKWQFYLNRVILNHEALTLIGDEFAKRFVPRYGQSMFQLCAVESNGLAIALAAQAGMAKYGLNVNLFAARKYQKKYGLFNRFEGVIQPNIPVVLVDDVCNSQANFNRIETIFAENGIECYTHHFTLVRMRYEAAHIEHLFYYKDFDLHWDEYVAKYGKEPEFGTVL